MAKGHVAAKIRENTARKNGRLVSEVVTSFEGEVVLRTVLLPSGETHTTHGLFFSRLCPTCRAPAWQCNHAWTAAAKAGEELPTGHTLIHEHNKKVAAVLH